MKQYRNTEELANTWRSWHIDAVKNIVSPISFGFHGGAKRENVLFKKDPEENSGFFLYSNSNRSFILVSVLTVFSIPRASLTSEGSKKSSASRLEWKEL